MENKSAIEINKFVRLFQVAEHFRLVCTYRKLITGLLYLLNLMYGEEEHKGV